MELNKTVTTLLQYFSTPVMIALLMLYMLLGLVVEKKEAQGTKGAPVFRQFLILLLLHACGMGVLYLYEPSMELLKLACFQLATFGVIRILYFLFYRKGRVSQAMMNHMLLLVSIGMIMVTRLNMSKGIKQSVIFAGSCVFLLILPLLVAKLRAVEKWGYFFAGVGILLLAAVFVLGTVTYGAKMSLSFGGFTIQPSEFVKISYVFAVASILRDKPKFKEIVIATVIAAVHVGILVLSTDLGSAVIYFIAYLIMLYTATGTTLYSLVGFLAGALASVGAYFCFGHVRVRVQVWMNPFADYQNSGYQICQSLFSYGAGGWWGTGLNKGTPAAIPFVEQDFMFSAIAEELGGVFCILMLFAYFLCIRKICRIAQSLQNPFYKLVAIGIASELTCQTFLTIGGGIQMIPLTGVTLPLVSYGGSSILSTVMMFGIMQGIVFIRKDEGERIEREEFETEQEFRERELIESDEDEFEGYEEQKTRRKSRRAIPGRRAVH